MCHQKSNTSMNPTIVGRCVLVHLRLRLHRLPAMVVVQALQIQKLVLRIKTEKFVRSIETLQCI